MLSKLNYVNVGTAGTFTKTGDYSTTPQDVDALIEHIRQQKKIVIHFHGGLIKEKKGIEIAERLAGEYQGAHPVTIVWETGPIETIKDNITSIHKTELFSCLLKWALKKASKYFQADVGKGATSLDSLSDLDIEQELKKERPFDGYEGAQRNNSRGGHRAFSDADLEFLQEEIEAEFEEEISPFDPKVEKLLLSEKINQESGDSGVGAKGLTSAKLIKDLAQISVAVIRRFVNGSHHGLYPTVVEEILQKYYLADLGDWIWSGMKLAAKEMWLPNNSLTGINQHAGTYLVEKLAELQQQTGVKIDLVGHSAGSIAICEMFKAINNRGTGLKIRNVVFLAPAVRYDLFSEEIVSKPDRYESFYMYTMSDKYECDDSLVPYVYTRSLLYFISGALEASDDVPIAGMERYLVQTEKYNSPDFVAVREFMQQPNRLILSNSQVLSPDSSLPYITTSEKHGDFDNDSETLKSINHLISQG